MAFRSFPRALAQSQHSADTVEQAVLGSSVCLCFSGFAVQLSPGDVQGKGSHHRPEEGGQAWGPHVLMGSSSLVPRSLEVAPFLGLFCGCPPHVPPLCSSACLGLPH